MQYPKEYPAEESGGLSVVVAYCSHHHEDLLYKRKDLLYKTFQHTLTYYDGGRKIAKLAACAILSFNFNFNRYGRAFLFICFYFLFCIIIFTSFISYNATQILLIVLLNFLNYYYQITVDLLEEENKEEENNGYFVFKGSV